MPGVDHYRRELAHAAWTWRECKVCPYHKLNNGRKDRVSGRAAKRRARRIATEEL